MASQISQNTLNASGSTFNNIAGNQYNIITTSDVDTLHWSLSPPRIALDGDQVAVSIKLKYYGDKEPVIDRVVLLDAKIGLSHLNEAIRLKLGVPEGYDVVIKMEQEPKIHVTPDHSCYDAQSRSGLCMSFTQTFADYFKAYRSFHRFLEPRKESSSSRMCRSTDTKQHVEVGSVKLQFNRTLRIPDDANTYFLPPSLGTFPLVQTSKYFHAIPPMIKARGGFLMPMFQREALWIEFRGNHKSRCAIKVSVGGINALTGLPRNIVPPDDACQDYVAIPPQPWLDGICVAPGIVRQFVAMPLGHGFTIEEQMTGQGYQGGIQFDVFPHLEASVTFRTQGEVPASSGETLSLFHSPKDSGVIIGSQVVMILRKPPALNNLEDYMNRVNGRPALEAVAYCRKRIQIFLCWLTGNKITLEVQHHQTLLALKDQLFQIKGTPHYSFSLWRAGRCMVNDRLLLSDYGVHEGCAVHVIDHIRGGGQLDKMGIAAGGIISQNIYRDSVSADQYDEDAVERLWIHTISSEAWETITGVVPPMSPITPRVYADYNYPWYKLYDENKATITPTGGFDHLRSVHQLDVLQLQQRKPSLISLDPEAPPPCTNHSHSTSICIFRPCSHNACAACLGIAIISNSSCPVCNRTITNFVGFKTPIPKVHEACGSVDGFTVEQDIVGVRAADGGDDNVISLFLEEDGVARLHGLMSLVSNSPAL